METKRIKPNLIKFYTAIFIRVLYLLTPVTLLFYQENGLSYKHLFLFQGIFYLTSVLVEFPLGYLSDRYSRKKLLMASLCIFLIVTVFWLFQQGFWIILAGEILLAISKVMLDDSVSGYLYDFLNQNKLKREMPKYYGYAQFCFAIGTVTASIIGTALFTKYGSKTVLICQFFFLLFGIHLINSLPNIRSCLKRYPFKESLHNFASMTKEIYKNPSIKYYIYYSGLLTSFSILFATSFQPLMQKSFFPIFMFGVIAFLNHGVRALSGLLAGKVQKWINIRSMVIPLYVLYVIAFILIFTINKIESIPVITILLFIICLIVGYQLLFTILHVSRLHKFVKIENRGNLMATNGIVSRGISAVVLISSKLLMDKMDLVQFYYCAFGIFILTCTYFMVKTYQIKDKNNTF